MPETTTIRPMAPADLPGVLETLRAALGETPVLQRTPQLWHWKHTLNPFGESIVLVAAEGARIAAVRALMKWRLVHPDAGELSCARPVDTAVHPDFRRRGLFRELNDAAIAEARAAGVDLVFNTPNAQSRPGYLKQGWADVGSIGVMVRPSTRLLARRRDETTGPSRPLLPGAEAPNNLPETTRPPLGLRTPRSVAYRKWRFEQHPTASYAVVRSDESAAAIRINRRNGRDELVVSELIGPTANRAISLTARDSTSGYLIGWFSSGTPERRQAVRAGMLPVPLVSSLNLVARPLSDCGVDVLDLANWDLALSDLELL